MSNCPRVTGISPNEGPPRTKLTIRGENLGMSRDDLVSVRICDEECLIFTDWLSSHKMITRSPRCVGTGEVVVTTKSGGQGISMIQFRAYEQVVGLTTSSGVWVDESDKFEQFDAHRTQSLTSPDTVRDSSVSSKSSSSVLPATSKRTISDRDFLTLFPHYSLQSYTTYVDMHSESFDPNVYLVENYSNSSFTELRRMYDTQLLRRRDTDTANDFNSNAFLKANIMPIMDCLNALNDFYHSFKHDRQEQLQMQQSTDLLAKLEENVSSAISTAHSIFDTIIERKDKTDSTRNALNVLQRYRFLFNLPSNIDRNLERRDYDVVVSDYFRAKNISSNSSVGVFKRVHDEVESQISTFTKKLRDDLHTFCREIDKRENTEELRKLIKYLNALESGDNSGKDPAWDSIVQIKERLLEMMNELRQKHMPEQVDDKNMKRTVILISNPTKGSDDFNTSNSSPKVQYIDGMTKLFVSVFPKLHRLGCDYLAGDLGTQDPRRNVDYFETHVVIPVYDHLCNEFSALIPTPYASGGGGAGTGDGGNSGNSSSSLTASLDPDVNWLPYCIRCISECYSCLMSLDLSQSFKNALERFRTFLSNFRHYTMRMIFTKAAIEIERLYQSETWHCQLDDVVGVRSRLPILFEAKVIEAIQKTRDSVLATRQVGEIDMLTQHHVKGTVKRMAVVLIKTFLEGLYRSIKSPITNESNIDAEMRILILLCNASYTSNYVLPKVQETFERFGYRDVSETIEKSKELFYNAEKTWLEMFIENKRDEVIGKIEAAMYMFDDWTSVNEMPREVSYYVKEVIRQLITIQADIYQVTPHLVGRVMFELLIRVIEEIQRLYECHSMKLTDAARVQILIDLRAIDHVVKRTGNQCYKVLKQKLKECRDVCSVDDGDKTIQRLVDEVTGQFCSYMQLQIACFNFDADCFNSFG